MTTEKEDTESRWTQRAVSLIVIVMALFALYGTNSKVSDLESRVSSLDVKFQELEGMSSQVDDLATQIDALQDSVDALIVEFTQLSDIRDDLVHAIRRALRGR